MSISLDSMVSLVDTNATTNSNANKIQSSLNGVSSKSTEDELLQVCKDFESYFVEEIIKEIKDNLTNEEDEKDSSLSTMTDYNMDFAIQEIAEKVVDDVGTNFTQQLYEQMKRNYGIE